LELQKWFEKFIKNYNFGNFSPQDEKGVQRIRGRSQITSRFGGMVEEFVTIQTQEISLYGKFVARGGGGSKK